MKKIGLFLLLMASVPSFAQEAPNDIIYNQDTIKTDIQIPYKRPIGFTYNFGSMVSMTFEGRFFVGVLPNITLVASPSFQKTPVIPFFDPNQGKWGASFDIKRINLGLGARAHFYEYDSWNGWYIEALGRPGLTWFGKDDASYSVIPSLMFGYQTVYDGGYTVNFGFGFEWEFLFGEDGQRPNRDFINASYYRISKVPLTGELSIGWTW